MNMRPFSIVLRPGQGFSPVLSRFAGLTPPRRRKLRRVRRAFPPPIRSARLYVEIDRSKVHLFRFYLETEENLGIMTVVDRWRAVLLVRYSSHQEAEMRTFLEGLRPGLDISYFSLNPA